MTREPNRPTAEETPARVGSATGVSPAVRRPVSEVNAWLFAASGVGGALRLATRGAALRRLSRDMA